MTKARKKPRKLTLDEVTQVLYLSQAEAAAALNIHRGTLKRNFARLKKELRLKRWPSPNDQRFVRKRVDLRKRMYLLVDQLEWMQQEVLAPTVVASDPMVFSGAMVSDPMVVFSGAMVSGQLVSGQMGSSRLKDNPVIASPMCLERKQRDCAFHHAAVWNAGDGAQNLNGGCVDDFANSMNLRWCAQDSISFMDGADMIFMEPV